MRYNLLYITTESQVQLVTRALTRMNANPIANGSRLSEGFEIRHRLLGNIVLQVNLITDLDAIPAHLRQFPVDLMIYDERGPDALPAPEAVAHIRKDVRSLADLWGPDFLFPMSRVVVILEREERQTERAFELGRLHVRDVCVAPRSLSTLLLWLKRVLTRGVIRKNRVGVALAGGGLEGFLYQLGCLYALEQAIADKPFNQVDVVSGVSSGAIAGGVFAARLPTAELIKALHGQSEVLPTLTSSLIFDLAGADIMRRILKQSIGWAGLKPQSWLNKTLRSIPTGLLKGENLENFFRAALEELGPGDYFENLETELYIGATDQDSYEHVIFGTPPWDKVRISSAVRASIALPPLFMPKHINGRWFIDGQVTKTTDLELMVEKGCSLIIIVNPLKPHTSTVPGTADQQGGVFAFIQTIKALVSSRFQSSLGHLTERYPDVDFMVFEPDEECAKLMAGSPMRYKIRTQITQLAYLGTLRRLRDRHAVYSVKLGKYGYKLRPSVELKDLESVDTSALGIQPEVIEAVKDAL